MADEIREMVSLGGMCWVAKLLETIRTCPCGPFDRMGTTPQMVADILKDNCVKLVDQKLYTPLGPRNGHYNHGEYSFDKYAGASGAAQLARACAGTTNRSAAAVFQHDGEHGVADLVAKMRRRIARFRNFVASPGWKVLVWGAALPYGMCVDHASTIAEVREMFKQQIKSLYDYMQNDDEYMKQFGLVGIIVVHSVPITCQVEDPRTELLSGKWRNASDALLTHHVQVKSTSHGGKMAW